MAHRQWQDANFLASKGKNDAYFNYQKKYEQMTKQQQLIEEKKQEIQKRLDDKRKKETEEALKKLQEDKQRSDSSRSKRGYYGYSKNRLGRDRKEETLPATLPANIFSNDGSFLEQFQKISGIKVEPRKKSIEDINRSLETNNGNIKKEDECSQTVQNIISGGINEFEREERRKERRWSSPERNLIPTKLYQQQTQDKQQLIPHQHVMQQPQVLQQQIIHQQAIHHQNIQHQPPMQHQPPLQQQVFTPQQIRPPMSMSYPPQFNPMQCGMMLPPPMTPSSIPPPAPLNPGSIPSPSPLQPCSIPSPSPLQPYAIPPPSPLLPHSIPPPRPMVPHSIPPPSPLTPHSIPPPLPMRPQNIPPPLQRPPMFLSMVPPPPPPPPPEEKKAIADSEKNSHSEVDDPNPKVKPNLVNNVRDMFRNDDYSSEDEDYKDRFDPYDERQISDTESTSDRKSPGYYSDKESYDESNHKMDSLSELESTLGQEPQSVPGLSTGSKLDITKFAPIVIEDTQTQFPSDNKDSSNSGEPAPADLSSDGDSRLSGVGGNGAPTRPYDPPRKWQEDIKVPKDMFYNDCDVKNVTRIKEEEMDTMYSDEKLGLGFKEDVKYEIKTEVKLENSISVDNVKSEEPVKKKRRSRWTDSAELSPIPPTPPSNQMLPGITVPPGTPIPPGIPVLPSIPVPPGLRPPCVGPVGMVVPTGLGVVNTIVPPLPPSIPTVNVPGMSGAMISKVTRTDTALVAYAMKAFGHTNLSEAEWKKAEDHYKINLLYQDMMRKREELQRLQAAGKNKYEYDSDEETDGGTWEHKLRSAEMEATQLWADELTEQAKGKHHIGDFLPPDELARFMEKYEALKEGREPDLSDYKEFKLKEDNVGFQMLQKLGWTEGQGLGPDGSGIMDPVNKAMMRPENQGLGVERPDDVDADDDEYDAYRKRMMLAYRFRPNPMNNPRRPYY